MGDVNINIMAEDLNPVEEDKTANEPMLQAQDLKFKIRDYFASTKFGPVTSIFLL